MSRWDNRSGLVDGDGRSTCESNMGDCYLVAVYYKSSIAYLVYFNGLYSWEKQI
jgi:hypothetical protein